MVDVYCDNGWTGTNTNRPEFQRLLNDINNGKIKALVIKDFSRFSRDYIEAGNLLENVFPFMGVRFISVADNYDSFETDGSAESLLIPLKNLINSYYSKDISKKVSTAVHTKQLAGEHIPSMIPYGYIKSTTREYRFEPDPETAANVTRIFQMRIDKVPLNHIANTFNDEGIPSPGKLRYLRGQTSDKRYETSKWSAQLIKQILRNPTYLGHLVFGRMPTALYLGKPNYQYEPDESKWRVLENMHEPLVSQEVFDKAKAMEIEGRKAWEERLEKSKEYRESNPPILKGFVYCGECGSKMRYHRYRPDQKLSGTYECPNYKYKKCGGTHSVSQDKLKEIVWNVLSDQLHISCDFEELIQKLNHSDSATKQQAIYKEEMQSILAKIKNRQGKRERLYEDFTEGILTPEEYQYNTICASPATSSIPGDYINAHSTEYNELLYYGDYTLRYAYSEFLKGGQEDLRGHILLAAMRELLGVENMDFTSDTAQDWFNNWKEKVVQLMNQNSMEFMEISYPKTAIMLNMMKKSK